MSGNAIKVDSRAWVSEAEPDERREGTEQSAFPFGAAWEITPERAREWFEHRFGWLFDTDGAPTRLACELGPLDANELALLRFDLSCYEGLLQRWQRGAGPKPPPLHDYLLPGREAWGEAARLARRLAAVEPEFARTDSVLTAALKVRPDRAISNPSGVE